MRKRERESHIKGGEVVITWLHTQIENENCSLGILPAQPQNHILERALKVLNEGKHEGELTCRGRTMEGRDFCTTVQPSR